MAQQTRTKTVVPDIPDYVVSLIDRILLLSNDEINAIHLRLMSADVSRRSHRFGDAHIDDTTAQAVVIQSSSDEAEALIAAALLLTFDEQRMIRTRLTRRRSALIREKLTYAADASKNERLRHAARHPEEHEGAAGRFQRKPSKRLTEALRPEKGLYDE